MSDFKRNLIRLATSLVLFAAVFGFFNVLAISVK